MKLTRMVLLRSLRGRALIAALVAIALMGCGGDPKPSAGKPDAGGPGGRPPEQQCSRPEELAQVLAPSVLGGGASIAQMVADGSHVYFSIGASLYRVPAQGGQAEEIFSDTSSYGFAFSRQSERVLVATDTEILELVPGAEPRALAQLPETPSSDLLSGMMPFVFADQRAYFAGSTSFDQGTTLYSIDLASGLSTSLGVAAEDISVLVHVGDALYWSESSSDRAAPYANALMRLPVSGGAVEEVGVDLGKLRLGFELLGAASDAVVLDVFLVIGEDNSDNSAVTASGIYRQSIAGGKAVQLVEGSALGLTDLFSFVSTRQVVQAGDELFMRSGTLQGTSIYSLAASASAPEKRFCVKLANEFVVAMAVVDDSVFLALSSDDESYIVRRDL